MFFREKIAAASHQVNKDQVDWSNTRLDATAYFLCPSIIFTTFSHNAESEVHPARLISDGSTPRTNAVPTSVPALGTSVARACHSGTRGAGPTVGRAAVSYPLKPSNTRTHMTRDAMGSHVIRLRLAPLLIAARVRRVGICLSGGIRTPRLCVGDSHTNEKRKNRHGNLHLNLLVQGSPARNDPTM